MTSKRNFQGTVYAVLWLFRGCHNAQPGQFSTYYKWCCLTQPDQSAVTCKRVQQSTALVFLRFLRGCYKAQSGQCCKFLKGDTYQSSVVNSVVSIVTTSSWSPVSNVSVTSESINRKIIIEVYCKLMHSITQPAQRYWWKLSPMDLW